MNSAILVVTSFDVPLDYQISAGTGGETPKRYDILFDWTEETFPELFLSRQQTQRFEEWKYRAYSETGTAVRYQLFA